MILKIFIEQRRFVSLWPGSRPHWRPDGAIWLKLRSCPSNCCQTIFSREINYRGKNIYTQYIIHWIYLIFGWYLTGWSCQLWPRRRRHNSVWWSDWNCLTDVCRVVAVAAACRAGQPVKVCTVGRAGQRPALEREWSGMWSDSFHWAGHVCSVQSSGPTTPARQSHHSSQQHSPTHKPE